MTHAPLPGSSASALLSQAARHELNLAAINEDLRRQVEMLETSTSYRLGGRILGLLRPVLAFAGLRRFAPGPAKVRIERIWPNLSGTIGFDQPNRMRIPVRVTAGDHELLADALDGSDAVAGTPNGPWEITFSFPYQLGFTEFTADALQVRIGNHRYGAADAGLDAATRCRPADVAHDTILELRGDVARLDAKLRERRRVALIASYRNTGRADAEPCGLVDALARLGFATVVIDTSEQPAAHLDCDLLIHRRNIGWDFASWVSALTHLPWLSAHADQVLLVNDSTVGPLQPLEDIVERGAGLGADVWGITDSWEITHHIQSYFVMFEKTALETGVLADFAAAYPYPVDKDEIIEAGEVGLSRLLGRCGLRSGVIYPYTEVAGRFLETMPERIERLLTLPENRLRADHRMVGDNAELRFLLSTADRVRGHVPLNPTHSFWDVLLEMGSPFLKRELLTVNPLGVPGLGRALELVDEQAKELLLAEARRSDATGAHASLPLAAGSFA